jgi:hypothetical protein
MDARLHSIKDPDGRMVNKVKVDGKEEVSNVSRLKTRRNWVFKDF